MKKNIFRVDDTLKSYTYPIIKCLICIVLLLFLMNTGRFFYIEKTIWRFIVGAICVCIGFSSILCICISVAEMIIIHDNRPKKDNVSIKEIEECKMYPIDEVMSLVNNNDIIEIRIISNRKIVEIGSSSDSNVGSSKFFDKLFYIGEKEFESLDDFQKELLLYSDNGQISITLIDGVSPKKYR